MAWPSHAPNAGKTLSPFPRISDEGDWAKEYEIGVVFAREQDYYRAITSFKRALILTPKEELLRKDEITYAILLSYYLGKKYDRAIETFEKSNLKYAERSFPGYHDMLLVLYECYEQTNDHEKANYVLKVIEKESPRTAQDLTLSKAILKGNEKEVKELAKDDTNRKYILDLAKSYEKKKKSPIAAQTLNAIIPGSGYLYLGQNKSALTSFLVNGLFIAAATQFFINDFYFAGAFTAGLEVGWYVGGIYGAKEQALKYNEKLYRAYGGKIMSQEHLFPILRLNYVF